MIRRCVLEFPAHTPARDRNRGIRECCREGAATNTRGACFANLQNRASQSLLARNLAENDVPCVASRSSSFFVQSQSQQAHGSVPFSCRQLRRECASFTLSSSKYSSQYGRSSASGGSQKQVSTQIAVPDLSTRASRMLCRYSSPATEPRPSEPLLMARMSGRFLLDFSFALTRYRMQERSTLSALPSGGKRKRENKNQRNLSMLENEDRCLDLNRPGN